MASWAEMEAEQPEFAAAVRQRLVAHKHLTMATIRPDGGPRISGTEVPIVAGELYLGGMSGNRRFVDLRRDARVAIHSGSDAPETWTGDAKVDGLAREVVDPAEFERFRTALSGEIPEGPFELFRVDLRTATLVRLSDDRDHLLIETWRPGRAIGSVVRR